MIDRHIFQMYTLFLFWTVLVFFWNIWLNDIWTANEAFYAEAVREMFENKNFLDIYYNYEPRFNKPPLTYWSIALSSLIFGLNEFAVRLPIVLYAIGSVILTFLIALRLYREPKIAFFSMFVMSFSLQFFINSRYASPEVPLLFFFTLTLYFFLVGYQTRRWIYIYLSYIALSLTVLTKGYPYLIVIGAIVIFYLLWENSFRVKGFFKDFLFLRIHLGIPIVLVLGFWWFVYMYVKFGNQFLDVYMEETLKRAIAKKSKGITDLFFYIYVTLWGFLPYSLVSFYGIFYSFKENIKKHSFVLSWIGVLRYKDIKLLPYLSALVISFTFVMSVLPIVEKYRPYDKIGEAVRENFIPKTTPLLIENRFIHNLPFYTKRKVVRDVKEDELVRLYYDRSKPFLALITEETLSKLKDVPVIWEGYIYKKSSESRFFVLVKYVIKAEHGDMSGFEKRYLVYRP